MKLQNIAIVVTVSAKSKKKAKDKLIKLMNNATCNLDTHYEFPEWGFWSEYKLSGDKVKK